MENLRKWWMSAIAVGALVIGLVLMLAFGKVSDTVWAAWVVGVGGTAGGYIVGNVSAKKYDGTVKKK
jgi:hypothetical protein